LPPRNANILYCLYIEKIFAVGDIILELILDGKLIDDQEIKQKGRDLDVTVLGKRVSIWINSTTSDGKLTARVMNNVSISAAKVGLEKIDT